jgi:hypothetical protein
MAEAVMSCPAKKILLPLAQGDVEIVGVVREPMPHLVKIVVEKIEEAIQHV